MPALLIAIRAALRQLNRRRPFAFLVVGVLGVGIGATTTIFSIFHAVVVRPLPFVDSGSLVGFHSVNPAKALSTPALSATDFRDLREQATSFSAFAARRPDFVSFAPEGGGALQVVAALVTEDFFPVLGVSPQCGRAPHDEEFSTAAPRVVVVSDAFWRRHLGAQRDVPGRIVRLNDQPTTIIGVMPPGFREPEFVDLWLPFPREAPEYFARDSRFWGAIGRLKSGVTLEHAQSEVVTLAAGLAREYPETNKGWSVTLQPLHAMQVAGLATTLALLAIAVGLVLLLACGNLANLLLARGVGRQSEFALRVAMGATPMRLAASVLLENLLLAAAGGGLGLLLAAGALPAIARGFPPGLLPRTHELALNGPVLLFAPGLALLTGMLCSLPPAWQAWRGNVGDMLKAAAARATASSSIRRAQQALVIGQIALTIAVVLASSLLVKSLLRLREVELGFSADNLLTVWIAPPLAKMRSFFEFAGYYEHLLDELRRVPGVEAVALDSSAPLGGVSLRYPFWIQGAPREEGNADEAVIHAVDHDYFATMKMPLRAGRAITERDQLEAPAVAVINEALARRIFPGQNPLGQRIQVLPWIRSEFREIVGVVGDVRQDDQASSPPPAIYLPQQQSPWFFATLLVRPKGRALPPGTLESALRRIAPTLGVSVRPLDELIDAAAVRPRLQSLLFAVFAAAAIGLSVFGLYASTSFAVNQRRRDIAVRMALGASPRRVVRGILQQTAKQVGLGTAVGIPAALVLAWLLRSTLYGVQPDDPSVLLAVILILPAVVLTAALLPALRAARINPAESLQQD